MAIECEPLEALGKRRLEKQMDQRQASHSLFPKAWANS
jgi:hypothetical protein